jgi:hypothetical protein
MKAFASIFFEVSANDSYLLLGKNPVPIFDINFEETWTADRQVELARLVPFGEIGVEVVLSIPFCERSNLRIEADSCANRILDRSLIQNGKGSRQT